MVEPPGGERIRDEVIDQLLAGGRTEEEIVGPGGLLAQLTKRLVERAVEVELIDHLGYEPRAEPPSGTGNTRNRTSPKTLITEHGQLPIDARRDRDGSFDPKIVRKRQRCFQWFDDKILALYSRGMSTRDIEAHLEEIYGGEGRPGADLEGHRRGHGRRSRLGPAAARGRLPGDLPRRACPEDP
jgi:transposase-like protein